MESQKGRLKSTHDWFSLGNESSFETLEKEICWPYIGIHHNLELIQL